MRNFNHNEITQKVYLILLMVVLFSDTYVAIKLPKKVNENFILTKNLFLHSNSVKITKRFSYFSFLFT